MPDEVVMETVQVDGMGPDGWVHEAHRVVIDDGIVKLERKRYAIHREEEAEWEEADSWEVG